jgi:outer membrane lipoprotein-sorting protein
MYKLILFFFQLSFITFFSQEYVPIKNIEVCNSGIVDKSATLNTMSADFEQIIYSDFFNTPKKSTGKIWFKMNDKVRWEHFEPNEQIIIIDGDNIQQKSANSKPSKSSTMVLKKMKSLIVGLIKSDFIHNNDFSITYFENTTNYLLELVPNNSRMLNYIKAINLILDKKNFQLIELQLLEDENEKITYKFSSIKYNHDILDTKFSTF